MILIADSGSTKCSWALCDKKGNIIEEISTIGFNPYFIEHDTIITKLKKTQLDKYKEHVTDVFFYGAGCSLLEKRKIIEYPLSHFFKNANINIRHDLEAACLATYTGRENITCILGTGSNSCFYNGKDITTNAPSLGFILGDEASGNYFGRKILNMYFNNLLPNKLAKELEKEFETDISIIQKNIYNNRANVFLAKYFPFIIKNKRHPLIEELIQNTLAEFITLHIKPFKNYQKVDINFIGSVAFFLSEEIEKIMTKHKLKIGQIIKNPIQKLIAFHILEIKKK